LSSSRTACLPKIVKIANESEGLASKCKHLWNSRRPQEVNLKHLWNSHRHHQLVSLDACVTEAFAQSGNTINYRPDGHLCNVKRCKPATGELQYNDVMYDVNDVMYDVTVNGDDVIGLDYRLDNDSKQVGWDVYTIIRK